MWRNNGTHIDYNHDKEYISNLEKSILFKDLDPDVAQQVMSSARWLHVKQGQYVYRQGKRSRRFFVVANGYVELSFNTENSNQSIVSCIGPGGHFGETSLLTNDNNSLDTRALSDLTLLCFDEDTFTSVLLDHKIILHHLCIALANRLRISFCDHAQSQSSKSHQKNSERNKGPALLEDLSISAEWAAPLRTRNTFHGTTISMQIERAVRKFSNNHFPVLLSGEIGTGRRMLAYEIHRASDYKNGPYSEIDILEITTANPGVELFGLHQESTAFSPVGNMGILEKSVRGTVVLYNADHIKPAFQRQLAEIIRKGTYKKIGGTKEVLLQSRIIFICTDSPGQQDAHNALHPALFSLIADHRFHADPLRTHRRDLPQLIQYYLQRYSLQYGKTIDQVDDLTLGMIMNYDWPGNLDEMATVMNRAVILGEDNQPLNNQILLGVPKPEGKWEFNLLRLPLIRRILTSSLYPVLPRLVIGFLLMVTLIVLFFGPTDQSNMGLIFCWSIGWPLLFFSFFLLARTWCSVCGLAIPGWIAQKIRKPKRATPKFIKSYSGWITTILCILLFWIELTWNAADSPKLTACILLFIIIGAFVFSIMFERRVWCRFICPLGALNALFSMASVLELRTNSHVCLNHCHDHSCYRGNDDVSGCPMLRHPFLVDNNRDCILCGQCIKSCNLQSIHLNLRLAPQELWIQRAPRLEDAFLIISLAAIFFFFANDQALSMEQRLSGSFPFLPLSPSPGSALSSSILFAGCISLCLFTFLLFTLIMARLTGSDWSRTTASLCYGHIPLILAAYMAVHLELFINGLFMISIYFDNHFRTGTRAISGLILSRDATLVVQCVIILLGLLASLLAYRNILKRLIVARPYSAVILTFPTLFLCLWASAYIRFIW